MQVSSRPIRSHRRLYDRRSGGATQKTVGSRRGQTSPLTPPSQARAVGSRRGGTQIAQPTLAAQIAPATTAAGCQFCAWRPSVKCAFFAAFGAAAGRDPSAMGAAAGREPSAMGATAGREPTMMTGGATNVGASAPSGGGGVGASQGCSQKSIVFMLQLKLQIARPSLR